MKQYIRIGLDKDQVTRQLGDPSTNNNNLWTYGSSHIKFNLAGKVIAWKNMFGGLDAAMQPYVESEQIFYLGSSKEDVLNALGSPTAVIDSFEQVWKYSDSHIKFNSNGLVTEWKNNYEQISMGLQKPVEGSEHIRIGSTKEAVLHALGAPKSLLAIDPNVWHYNASHVKFKNGHVIEWRNQFRQLDIGMKRPEKSHKFLTIGCSEEDILMILGSPTEILAINSSVWHYKASHILYEDHKVVEWKNVYNQLDIALKVPKYNDFLRIGLRKDEVLEIFGSPDRILKINPDVWYFDTSHINFKENTVCGWRYNFRDLEGGIKKGSTTAEDIKIGVGKDLVRNRLGTPSFVSEIEPSVWHYGNATVTFDQKKEVVSWQNIDDIKKHVANDLTNKRL